MVIELDRLKRTRVAPQHLQVGLQPQSAPKARRSARNADRGRAEDSSDEELEAASNSSDDEVPAETHRESRYPRRDLPRRACQQRADNQETPDRQDRSKSHSRLRSKHQGEQATPMKRELVRLLEHNFDAVDWTQECPGRYNMRRERKGVEQFQIADPAADPKRLLKRPRCEEPRNREVGSDTDGGSSTSRRRWASMSSGSNSSDERRKSLRILKKYKMAIDPMAPRRSNNRREKVARGPTDTCGDVTPLALDRSITWESCGGLGPHIRAVKEMVILPMLYPEVYDKFRVSPPLGVLFVGPPGTGKTLLARSLANACSVGDRKVAFFMRKGADILSKWVGESEKQLRVLFEEARARQPSIIFFDELDGLAPVRSARNDHTHAAIVSTLLALIDGLDSRGQVILIGATNRVDTIDPALRRPGRFDRELLFTLPNARAREEILRIHTAGWRPPVPPAVCRDVALRTAGYCGADLRALCVEAPLRALRRTFPQIYTSGQRLVIDVDAVTVEPGDWERAMAAVTPAAQRNPGLSHAAPLPPHLHVTLQPRLDTLKAAAILLCPALAPLLGDDADDSFADLLGGPDSGVRPHRGTLLITGPRGTGSRLLFRALLHELECAPRFVVALDAPTAGITDEEALVAAFAEARRAGPACICLPGLDDWWAVASPRARLTLRRLLHDAPRGSAVLVIIMVDAFSPDDEDGFGPLLANLPDLQHHPCGPPTEEERRAFWRFTADTDVFAPPPPAPRPPSQWPTLPVDPNPPPLPVPTAVSGFDVEQRQRHEDTCVRQLRVFIRETLLRLLNDRRFSLFVRPIESSEADAYARAVAEPLWLMDCLERCNEGRYTTIQSFVADIEAIRSNATAYYGALDDDRGKKAIGKVAQLYDYVLLDVSRMDRRLLHVCSQIHAEKNKDNTDATPPDGALGASSSPNLVTKAESSPAAVPNGAASPSEPKDSPSDPPPTQMSRDITPPPASIFHCPPASGTDIKPLPTPLDATINPSKLTEWVNVMVHSTGGMDFDQLEAARDGVLSILHDLRAEPDRGRVLAQLMAHALSLALPPQ